MPETELRLIVLPVSPWSERARWALDHHRLAYRTIVHTPFLGERRLRRYVGKDKPRATVPVLLAGDRVYSESWDIARYADQHGSGAPLIVPAMETEIRAWCDRADEAMQSGRALLVEELAASSAALDEVAPPAIPRPLRPLVRPVARFATRWLRRKYSPSLESSAELQAKFREKLELLRPALRGGDYLLGSFTFADIVMATCLQSVMPVPDRYIPIGPATREVWTQPELAAELSDLIAWRDRLYEKHRPPRSPGD